MSSLREKWSKLTRGWFGNIVYIVLGILVAIAINEGLKPVLHTDLPIVAVFSDSMVPTFYKGDLIVVYGAQNISLGDIVVYDAPDPLYRYPIIHRVVNITKQGFITKGDNNPARDPWTISKDRIHGKAIARIPLLGWVKVGVYETFGLV